MKALVEEAWTEVEETPVSEYAGEEGSVRGGVRLIGGMGKQGSDLIAPGLGLFILPMEKLFPYVFLLLLMDRAITSLKG